MKVKMKARYGMTGLLMALKMRDKNISVGTGFAYFDRRDAKSNGRYVWNCDSFQAGSR